MAKISLLTRVTKSTMRVTFSPRVRIQTSFSQGITSRRVKKARGEPQSRYGTLVSKPEATMLPKPKMAKDREMQWRWREPFMVFLVLNLL
jgi:hypothetical protein